MNPADPGLYCAPRRQRPSAHWVAGEARRRLPQHFFDESCSEPPGIAIYSLCDPATIRDIRYVGQSSAPRRRYLQHIRESRLWLDLEPQDWWVVPPRLRRPYQWIRSLFNDHGRFPLLVIHAWVPTTAEALREERRMIGECVARGLSLCNREASPEVWQLPLL